MNRSEQDPGGSEGEIVTRAKIGKKLELIGRTAMSPETRQALPLTGQALGSGGPALSDKGRHSGCEARIYGRAATHGAPCQLRDAEVACRIAVATPCAPLPRGARRLHPRCGSCFGPSRTYEVTLTVDAGCAGADISTTLALPNARLHPGLHSSSR